MNSNYGKKEFKVSILISCATLALSFLCSKIIPFIVEIFLPDFLYSLQFSLFGVTYKQKDTLGVVLMILLSGVFFALFLKISFRYGWLPKPK